MSEKVIRWLEEQVSRRSVFGRAGMAALGAVLGMVGLSSPAKGLRFVACCTLCSEDCSGTCPGCSWSWLCCYTIPASPFHPAIHQLYQCLECYAAGADCNGGCGQVVCSKATLLIPDRCTPGPL